jgi:glutathione S-transferase
LRDRLTCDEAFGWEPPADAPVVPDTGDPTSIASTANRPELPAGADTAEEHHAVTDGGTREADDDGHDSEPTAGARAAAREALSTLGTRLSPNTQVVFLTPLADATAGAVARRLDAVGHDVTVASPDVTATDTPARRLAAVERRLRVERLRRDGLTVSEWTPSGDPTDPSGWSI